MITIEARNVHAALPKALSLLETEGVRRDSRNGPVVLFPQPVTTVYERPTERVMFWDQRDANPYFHFFESLWMLAGRNDVHFVGDIVKQMYEYTDDGETLNGAYGHRWCHHFGRDQLAWAIHRLRENPDDRRVVVGIWDAHHDPAVADTGGRDVPCNVTMTLQINTQGRLDMCVFNRSNDLVWGCYGANAVHFSYVQEFVARGIGVPVGRYWQISANLHAYENTLEGVRPMVGQSMYQPYDERDVNTHPLMMDDDHERWTSELRMFLDEGLVLGIRDPFFRRVAQPLWESYGAYRDGRFGDARVLASGCASTDWSRAVMEWLHRREEKARERDKAGESTA